MLINTHTVRGIFYRLFLGTEQKCPKPFFRHIQLFSVFSAHLYNHIYPIYFVYFNYVAFAIVLQWKPSPENKNRRNVPKERAEPKCIQYM